MSEELTLDSLNEKKTVRKLPAKIFLSIPYKVEEGNVTFGTSIELYSNTEKVINLLQDNDYMNTHKMYTLTRDDLYNA